VIFSYFYRWATALCPGTGEFHCDNSKCIKSSLRCDGYDHCGDHSDEICHLPDMLHETDDFNITSMLTVAVAVISLVLVLVMIIALVSRAARRHVMIYLRSGREAASGEELSSPREGATCHHRCYRREADDAETTSPNARAPSIQTVGDRRFYVLPSQGPHSRSLLGPLSVIEAPPTYADAIKHSTRAHSRLPTETNRSASAYNNMAFMRSPRERTANRREQGAEALDSDRDLERVQPCENISTREEQERYAGFRTSSASPTLESEEFLNADTGGQTPGSILPISQSLPPSPLPQPFIYRPRSASALFHIP